MLGMGWIEIFVVVIITLFAVGPEKLPEVARGLARFVRQVQRVVGEFRETIDLEEFNSQVRHSGAARLDADVKRHLETGPADQLGAGLDFAESGYGTDTAPSTPPVYPRAVPSHPEASAPPATGPVTSPSLKKTDDSPPDHNPDTMTRT